MVPAASCAPWFVYLIRTASGRLYAGITTDPARRFEEHRRGGKKGAKFFRSDPPVKIVFQQPCPSRSEALKLEHRIRKLSRKEKLSLLTETPCGI